MNEPTNSYRQWAFQPTVVYRVVHTEPATLHDVKSMAELSAEEGEPYTSRNKKQMAKAVGLSVFDSREVAESVAFAARGAIGTIVASLPVPIANVQMELTARRGHWTLWENLPSLVPQFRDYRVVAGLEKVP